MNTTETFIYKRIDSVDEKALYHILNDLPQWFGIADYVKEYVEHSVHYTVFGCYDDGELIGFLTLKPTSISTLEIYVMGILHQYQHQGIGRNLMQQAFDYAIAQGILFLQVKTLDPSVKDPHYLQTYKFYESMGFVPVEVLPLWDEWNPCLLMIQKMDTQD